MSLLTCEWRKLAFANYKVPAELVEKHLPAHTRLDYFNGNCLVSLVGFQFKNVEAAGIKVPFHTDFEEINLRFYVKRFDGAKWRKGTVFISEIADKPVLSTLANTLFRENYTTVPTRQEIEEDEESLKAAYFWQLNGEWQHISVKSNRLAGPVPDDSESKFIMDRPFGYGELNEKETNEYHVSHADWHTYTVEEYSIKVDFAKQFGAEWSMLSSATPHSVILAEGSTVSVEGTSKIES